MVAVWIRGSVGDILKLTPDWVSNFNIGINTKKHKGFGKAEEELNKGITQYLSEMKKKKKTNKKIKFWITGHSRGAAIANLYGSRMTREYGKNSVFAYTFASPYVSTKGNNTKGQYNNIVNYVNPGDIVAAVPPKDMKYKRYGKDYVLKSDYSQMTKIFKSKTGVKFIGNHTKKVVDDFNEHYKKDKNIVAYFKGLPSHEIEKIKHAHSQTLYLSWIEALYD